MSELINNREARKETLKNIIKQLHAGKTVDEVKDQFGEVFEGVSASEISEAEAALVMEGVPIEEIQNLCDVHAAVFKGSIEEIHEEHDPVKIPGHPLNVLERENRIIEKWIDTLIEPNLSSLQSPEHYEHLRKGIEQLKDIECHYSKKENLLFPYLEKYEVTAPPKVMWGVDDEIRGMIKHISTLLSKSFVNAKEIVTNAEEMIEKIREMIFKEEHILFPMLAEKLSQDEWIVISKESKEIGFLIDNVPEWKAVKQEKRVEQTKAGVTADGMIRLPSGHFTLKELELMLNTLPFDITFVGKDDNVKYFSEAKERIFPRTRTIVGRNVSNCHPPASVHIVEGIVEDFKSGKKDNEDFWIQRGDLFVLIRYFAVRDQAGEYVGVLEVTQNVKAIRELTGEKRLVSE